VPIQNRSRERAEAFALLIAWQKDLESGCLPLAKRGSLLPTRLQN
jgi:hypothetical protein